MIAPPPLFHGTDRVGSGLADIRPFRGIRYNEARYSDLSPVLAPPYDVISRQEHARLIDLSPRNVVRLIIGERYKSRKKGTERYAGAAALLDQWLGDETLVQDRVPALYLLDQEFEEEGRRHVRRAFIARLRIEAFGKGCVFPHEQTMPGPRADRLALMKATRMNMSQVFGLYPDDGAAGRVIDRMGELDPVGEGTGIDGVRNVVRPVYHRGLIGDLVEALSEQRIIVADGHHRYETTVAYRDEMRLKGALLELDKPHDFVSVALVSMGDPGLVIRPTHRLIRNVRGFSPADFFRRAEKMYQVEEVPADAAAIVDRLAQVADRHAFGIVTSQGARVLVRTSGKRGAAGRAQTLDTHILHHELFGELIGLGPDAWKKEGPVDYVQSAEDCVSAAASGKARLAALVNPTRIDEVQAIALAGETMPPKSTFFYPKFPTGIVINPLI